jgi:peptidyl-prolyl cis-trans isomerase D
MTGGAAPSDADIEAAYRSNIARYTIPERRVLRYALFDAAQVAAAAKASEADIQAAYKQHGAEYAARETRILQQVVLQSEAAARSFAQKLAAGTSFEAAAQQAGYAAADIAIGEQSREAFAKISSPAAAAAAFSAAKGATTQPIKSPFGWHIVRVAEIRQSAGKPIEAVRAQLVTEVEQRKTQEALSDLAAKIEEAVSNGASFEDVVKANKLAVIETPPVTAGGFAPGAAVAPEVKPLLESGFALSPGDDPSVETVVPNQRFAVLSVVRVIPAAPPPLAQIKDQVRADLVAQRALARARTVATAILAKINAGKPAAQAFAEARLPAPATLSGTRREVADAQGRADPARVALFAIAPGKARLLPAPQGRGWIIVQLARIDRADPAKSPEVVQAVQGQFVEILGQEYGAQFRNAILAGMKVKRNPQALADAKAQLGRGAAQ